MVNKMCVLHEVQFNNGISVIPEKSGEEKFPHLGKKFSQSGGECVHIDHCIYLKPGC